MLWCPPADPSSRARLNEPCRRHRCAQRLVGAPVHPNGGRQRACDPRDPGRSSMVVTAKQIARGLPAGNHLNLDVNGPREAPTAATAIKLACSNLAPPWRLRPRHGPPVRVRGTKRSNRHAQRAALSRPSLANPLVCAVRAKAVQAPSGASTGARLHETGRRGSSSTSRSRARGGAPCTSAKVRRSCRARRRCLRAVERVLFERAQNRSRAVRRLWA